MSGSRQFPRREGTPKNSRPDTPDGVPSAAVLIMAGAAFSSKESPAANLLPKNIKRSPTFWSRPRSIPPFGLHRPALGQSQKNSQLKYARQSLSSGGGGDHEKFSRSGRRKQFPPPLSVCGRRREIFVVGGPFGDDLCVTLLIPSLSPNMTFFSPKNKGQKSLFFRLHSIFRRETPVRRGRTVC